MNTTFDIPAFRSVFLMLLFCTLGAVSVSAQSQDSIAGGQKSVEIINAHFLYADEENGETIYRLMGNVHVRQDSTDLWADRAIQNETRKTIRLEGHVRIVDQADTLWADLVEYDYSSETKIGSAEGNVRLSDGDVEVTAPSGIYFVEEKRAQFDNGVRLVDSTAVLTSRNGAYWTELKRADFFNEVHLHEDRTNVDADSMTYYRETEISEAWGNVFIERRGGEDLEDDADSLTVTLLFGNEAYSDNKISFRRVTGDPLLLQMRQDSVGAPMDTLVVRARVLEASRHDSLQRLIALDSVRVWQRSMAAIADSMVFDRILLEDSTKGEFLGLYRNPIAWFRESQVSGDTLLLRSTSSPYDSLFTHQNAFIAQRDTVLDRIHQIRGNALVGLLSQDTLRMLDVGPNAELIYFRSNVEEQLDGAVRTTADRILFFFKEGELARTSIQGRTEGTLYPPELIPDNFALEGFQWRADRRPERQTLLDDPRVRERLEYIAGRNTTNGFAESLNDPDETGP